ncbi:MAG: helix-turn-helix transcriptional regulator [Phycisphaerales bacterium]|jgi:transcriptional regulator with XRE-family HTH domain|nr:helix-turn-helix transcriptional regulator [Phycisphaerales bacterium]
MPKKKSIDERIRQEIRSRGLSAYRVAKETGISEPAVGRFMNAGKTLTLANAEKMLAFLGAEIVFPHTTKKG